MTVVTLPFGQPTNVIPLFPNLPSTCSGGAPSRRGPVVYAIHGGGTPDFPVTVNASACSAKETKRPHGPQPGFLLLPSGSSCRDGQTLHAPTVVSLCDYRATRPPRGPERIVTLDDFLRACRENGYLPGGGDAA